jgi:hypothetical protein
MDSSVMLYGKNTDRFRMVNGFLEISSADTRLSIMAPVDTEEARAYWRELADTAYALAGQLDRQVTHGE